MEEAHVNSTTATHMLRSEIRRLMADRSQLRQERIDNDRSALNTERKIQVFQEMIDKLKTERYDLQRSNYVLKRRIEDSERKVFDAKIKARKNVRNKSEKNA
jgi:predicted RNase H-like nuclease (RuvC/YqgF family)